MKKVTRYDLEMMAEKAELLSLPKHIESAVIKQEKMHPAKPASYYRYFYHLTKYLKPDVCVELGTNWGVSAACLALGNPAGIVKTFDIRLREPFEGCDLSNIHRFNCSSLSPVHALERIDILFIDTSSKGTQNLHEYNHWIGHMKPYSIVFIDDIYIVKDHKGDIKTDLMADFWLNFKPKGQKFELPLHGENRFGCILIGGN